MNPMGLLGEPQRPSSPIRLKRDARTNTLVNPYLRNLPEASNGGDPHRPFFVSSPSSIKPNGNAEVARSQGEAVHAFSKTTSTSPVEEPGKFHPTPPEGKPSARADPVRPASAFPVDFPSDPSEGPFTIPKPAVPSEKEESHPEATRRPLESPRNGVVASSPAPNASEGVSRTFPPLSSLPRTPSPGYLCLILDYHPLGDLCRYTLRVGRGLGRQGAARSASPLCSPSAPSSPRLIDPRDPTFRNPLVECQLVSIAYQIASALRDLHTRSPPVVHRDLKPENVLIVSDGKGLVMGPAGRDDDEKKIEKEKENLIAKERKETSACRNSRDTLDGEADVRGNVRILNRIIPIALTDFGLTTQELSGFSSGCGVGTRPYISPEAWCGETSTTNDIWSFGCLLYALATGCLTARTARIMYRDSSHDGFASMIMNDLIEHKYSLAFASFVLSLLTVNPLKRPTAATAMQCFRVQENEIVFDMMSSFFSNVLDL
ncbi:unnamed protein product [Phytomonas sp. EM1]|nr:unnamed protein product [Phytomonas sp. EM1]|eukprot:CCW60225.1 unnamed protein product [Phytomonas sp. isolate EM1]